MARIDCRVCPRGCRLRVEERGGKAVVSGQLCIRGEIRALKSFRKPFDHVPDNPPIKGV